MTIRELVSRCRSTLKEVNNDSYLSNRHLWQIISSVFSKYLDQRKNIYKLDLFNTINIDTEEVNLLEESCVPLNCLGCRIKLDEAMETKDGLVFRYIATPDMSKTFKLVSPKLYMLKHKKTKGNSNFAFYDNGYLYFNNCFPCLKISYLSKTGQSNEGCSVLENNINIPDYMVQDIVAGTLSEYQYFLQKPQDKSANKSDQE